MNFKTFDYDKLRLHFKGDEEILIEMINTIEVEHKNFFVPLKEAIAKNNNNELRISSHALKGVMANLFAENARDLSLELESLAQNQEGSLEFHGRELLQKLENEVGLLLIELEEFKAQLKIT